MNDTRHTNAITRKTKKSTSVNKFNYSYDLKDIGGKILVTEEFQTKIDKKIIERTIPKIFFEGRFQYLKKGNEIEQ
mgnify:CR=1 FL=1